MMMMTSKKSNINKIRDFLLSKQSEYKDLEFSIEEIENHFDHLDCGNGIRILNSLSSNSMGIFIFYGNGFRLLVDFDGLAKSYKIEEDLALSILSIYYLCRFLTRIPTLYDNVIISYTKELNSLVSSAIR